MHYIYVGRYKRNGDAKGSGWGSNGVSELLMSQMNKETSKEELQKMMKENPELTKVSSVP